LAPWGDFRGISTKDGVKTLVVAACGLAIREKVRANLANLANLAILK
jgi:hypothetical protein